jgi:hypothetical protein
MATLSVFGREHQKVPKTNGVQENDSGCRVQGGSLRKSNVWSYRDTFGYQIVGNSIGDQLWINKASFTYILYVSDEFKIPKYKSLESF